MGVVVSPRRVGPPWAEPPSSRPAAVLAEGIVEPDPGVLARYRTVWPHRFVVWDRPRQLWEIRQRNPMTGQDERIEFLFTFDAPIDPVLGRPWTAEELAELVEINDGRVVRVFEPFDHEFVTRRFRDRWEFYRLGTERQTAARMKRNQIKAKIRLKDTVRNRAAAIGEFRRWLPAMRSGYAHDRIPQVRGGLTQ